MEVHAPDHPVHSWRDFAIHIAVVTIGILIALGLDGLREYVHERHLVREMRENVRTEMAANYGHGVQECSQVRDSTDALTPLVANLQASAQQPERIAAQLRRVSNPYYFLSASSWQTALSTGALAHMSTSEVAIYANASSAVAVYTQLQKEAFSTEMQAKAFFAANPHPSAAELSSGLEKLAVFAHTEQELANVCPQMQRDIRRALVTSGGEASH